MPSPAQAAALAHYLPMAAEAAQVSAVKHSLTPAKIFNFAESHLAQQRQLAASFVAKAETLIGSAECGRLGNVIDTLRNQVDHVYLLAQLCASVGAFSAADRISATAEATSLALIDQAYRCRMLSIPGWAPGRLAAQPADAAGPA